MYRFLSQTRSKECTLTISEERKKGIGGRLMLTLTQNTFSSIKNLYCVRMCVHACAQSCLTLCDPRDCSPPSSLFMEFSRQEYWSRLPLPTPGALSHPGIEPASPVPPASAGRFFTTAGFFTTASLGTPYCMHYLKVYRKKKKEKKQAEMWTMRAS